MIPPLPDSPSLSSEALLPRLLRVAQHLSEQRDVPRLLEALLDEALYLCQAHTGWVWLYADSAQPPGLRCLCRQGSSGPLQEDAALFRPVADGDGPVQRCFAQGSPLVVQVSDAALAEADRPLLAALAPNAGGLRLWPLRNHEGAVIGVLQLAYSRKMPGTLTRLGEHSDLIFQSLLTYAGIALSNLSQVQDLKELLDAFIKVLAQAIDAKSPHTSAHCQRVPVITEMLAQAVCDDGETFADFSLDEDGWYELHVAAWLHDCGKLATPDSVLDKSTKLHTLHDRIEEVSSRFASLRARVEFDYERACLENPSAEPEYRRTLEAGIQAITDDLTFLERINRGGEAMAEADQQRVRDIAARQWTDAWGRVRPLLTEDEVENLCIARGTLTPRERQIINGHMDVTLDMLESLPFPAKLRQVPEYAGGHHEKMDGSGFPRGLTREQMSIPARIMAIADVFEALTSRERPYKMPLRLSEALGIMQRMRNNQHLDPDLYRLFILSGVWRQYGQQFLDPQQLDVDDASAFL
ncbi:chemotaxis sensory transducer family protein [Alcanivorax hongdengensis A-11-3]|uniref:Chemotaxis sensory transducer family protein n=1 Tax=Alcanivorax hongdengensis A-11-3 TaxID=1177179 RepID=L0WG86_9GAMM|nr:HD domain-containing phosphohydrolase [Alcanivorax hongdengensis]EKF75858.1 chemotaxis sensory transducer family protein [Alcanivorax hongdengensis A-11-3]